MSEMKTTPAPFLSFEGGINTNASLVDMAANEAEEIINYDLTNEKSLKRRKAFDFIGERADGSFFFNCGLSLLNDGEYIDTAPSCVPFTVPLTTGELRQYVVAHCGDNLKVWDIEDEWINLKNSPSQTIDLSTSISSVARWYKTKWASDRNKLFLLSKGIDPGYVYMNTSNELEYTPISVFVRNTTQDNPPSDSQVNNDGNNYLCIKTHTSSSTTEPGTGEDWRIYWVLYGPELSGGASWADATEYTSNIELLDKEYTTITFASGRIWIGGITDDPSKVYFSQQVIDDLQYGRMYQFADPLNEDDNVKVETDGGSLIINGAEKILRLHEYKNGVMIFASNGVWYVGGKSGTGFNAVDFDVEKVSSDGIIGEEAAVDVEDKLIYFGYGGAYVIVRDEVYYTLKTLPISDKIEKFWSVIPLRNRRAGKAIYNPSNKRLYFFTNFENFSWQRERNPYNQATHFRDALVMNVKTDAWYKYSLSKDSTGDKVSIGDVVSFAAPSYSTIYLTDNDGAKIVDSSGKYVTSSAAKDINEFVNLCLFMKKSGGDALISFGHMDGELFQDFHASLIRYVVDNSGNTVTDNDGNPLIVADDREDYSCTYLSAFHTFKELRHKKKNSRIVFAFKRVESGLFNDEGEDITAGGCLFTPLYDWKNTSSVSPIQVYRPDTWTTGFYEGKRPDIDVVYVKDRIRGKGQALQFKFESDGTKDMELLGFQVDIMSNARI